MVGDDMAIKIDLTGKRFGKLSVLEKTNKRSSYGAVLWKCLCDCGKHKLFRTSELTTMNRRSCGCILADINKKRLSTHKSSKTRLYKIWDNMKSRCFNPNHDYYHRYGGRGVTICEEWMDFRNFKEWSLSNGYNDNLSIDRVNFDGNYEPSNCRWIYPKKQLRNTSRTVYITKDGVKKPMQDWCEELGIKPATVINRIRKGYPEELLLVPAGVLLKKKYQEVKNK